MTIDEFWEKLDALPHGEAANDVLRKRLEPLGPVEIVEFQKHFDEVNARAYSWALWGAAYIICGGCSDDGFIDFRYGLISRGRKVFEDALTDPESLVEVASADEDDDGYIPNEEFGYVADELYEEKTGDEDMPGRPWHEHRPEPSGEEWDFDDPDFCAKKLPRLWKRFGS